MSEVRQATKDRFPSASVKQTMSGAPREPEKYSVEEMMERLKAKPQEENPEQGELVTRADGTQAIRLRKRKRRSRQPHKERSEKKSRYLTLQVSVVLGLIVLTALAAGGLMIYANTAPYREGLIAKASAATGAVISLREVRVSPAGANAAEVGLQWPEGNVLASLDLKAVEAETFLSSFFGKAWTGDELRAREGHVILRAPVAGAPTRATPAPEQGPTVSFNRIGISNSRFSLGDPSAPAMELRDAEASFYPTGAGGFPQLQLSRGKVRIPGWPEFRLDRSFMEFRNDEVEVVSLRLLDASDDKGTLILSGSLRPYTAAAPSSLAVRMESFPLSGLIGPGPASLVTATLETHEAANSNFLTIAPGSDAPASLLLAFRATPTSRIEVAKLALLRVLANSLDAPWFERPVFSDIATGTLRRDSEMIYLGLDVQAKGQMGIKGEIEIDADLALGGRLEIGLAEAFVEANPRNGFSRLFTRSADGFRWVTITLAGTATAPLDDFAAQLAEILATPEKPGPGAGPSFEDLTSPR